MIQPSVADCFLSAPDWSLSDKDLLERIIHPMLAHLRKHAGSIPDSEQLHLRMTVREVSAHEMAMLSQVPDIEE